MAMENLVAASAFCTQHNIELAFIQSLQNYGLIETTTTNEEVFLQPDQLQEVERLMRLHYDLNINLEGVAAITQVLKRLEKMQDEITGLKSRLQLYEGRAQATAG